MDLYYTDKGRDIQSKDDEDEVIGEGLNGIRPGSEAAQEAIKNEVPKEGGEDPTLWAVGGNRDGDRN